jgi:hypothetical protein
VNAPASIRTASKITAGALAVLTTEPFFEDDASSVKVAANGSTPIFSHNFATALASSAADYPEYTDRGDDRFSTVNAPIASIAASLGQNDSGVFELNFRDERYIPFEGAGAVSRWRLELPSKVRQFDYALLADAILHVRYTSLDGGDKLRGLAEDAVQAFLQGTIDLSRWEGLFTLFDLRSDFPNEWARVTQATGLTPITMALSSLAARLPFFTKATGNKSVTASNVYLFWRSAAGKPKAPSLQQGAADPVAFGDVSIIEQDSQTKTFGTPDAQTIPIDDTWIITFDKAPRAQDTLWLIVEYSLTG